MGMYEFNPGDAMRFARWYGARTRQIGDELRFAECPYCKGRGHDKDTFSINLNTGQFKCLRAGCGVTGNMLTLSRDFDFSLGNEVDEYYRPKKQYRSFKTPAEPIKPKEPAVAYLESRGISAAVAERYEITTLEKQQNILAFPFYDETGKLRFIKYRKTDFDKAKDKNKEWCEKDCRPILFGMKQCNDKFDRLILTEGQLDSLSVATAGIENAVSVPTGAKGFTWVPYCYNWVSKFEEIIVFGDFEKNHITLLEEVARRFPCRIKHVREADYRNCKDANEMLQKYGTECIRHAVENAVYLPVNHVLPLSEVENVNIYELEKVKSGISELDKMLYGGLPFGMVCVIAGKRGDGKSTLASQIIARVIDQGYAAFTYSGELPNYLYKSWFDFQVAGRHHIVENQTEYGTVNRFITNANQELINAWYQEKAFIYDNRIVENDEKEDLLKSIERSIQQYGVRVVLIDNLMTAMYIDEQRGSDRYEQQGQFVRNLTKLAIKYNCLILLVAHQRKNGYSTDINDEVSGSGDITNLAGLTIGYNRGNSDEMGKSMSADQRKLIVAKNRLFGKINLNGIILDYDERSKRIYGTGDNLDYQYGWDKSDGFYSADIDESDECPFK